MGVLQVLVVLLLIHQYCLEVNLMLNALASYITAEDMSSYNNTCNASCGNLGSNVPFPFAPASSASCALSSSFLLSNCSSPQYPSWQAFTQTMSIPSDDIQHNIVGPPAVMGIFTANSSTFIDLAWEPHLISQPDAIYHSPACSSPVPRANLSSTIPPSIDLISNTFPNSTVRFSTNNVLLLFNCTKSTADDSQLFSSGQTVDVDANSVSCQSYRRQCPLVEEYYTSAGHCVQLSLLFGYNSPTQLSLQQAMNVLGCTHFQFFVVKAGANDVNAITEWSKAIIQLQWTVADCWRCIQFGSGSCVLDSTYHTFQRCTNCTYGPDSSDRRFCNDFYIDGSLVANIVGILLYTAAAVCMFLVIVVLPLYCCWRIRRRRRAAKSIAKPTKFGRNSEWPLQRHELSSGSNESLDDLDLNGLAERPMEYSHTSIASATGSFSSIVGEGAFGVVFKGALNDEQEIAVKVLQVRSKHSRKQFLNEVAIIGRIHHVNVVRLLGFCAQHKEHDRMLVYEYVVNGSLDAWLFSTGTIKLAGAHAETGKQVLEWGQRYGIALGVARGLSYLHEECRHRIVHCDIKPQNILLDACMCPKISDFGLARLMGRDESRVVTLAKGTPGYMAPEFWVGGDIHLGTKADVYSYGMVLLELVSGRRNFALGCQRFPAVAFEAAMRSDFDSIIDVRLQAVMPAAEEQRILMQQQVRTAVFVALWCIQEQPTSRPSMSEVVQYLEGRAAVSEQPPRPTIACASCTMPALLLPITTLETSSSHLQDLTQISEGR